MLQQVEIIGQIYSEATSKVGSNGKEFMSFKVVVHEGSDEKRKDYYYNVLADRTAVMEHLTKDKKVFVSGKLTPSVSIKDDHAYLNLNVFARNITLI